MDFITEKELKELEVKIQKWISGMDTESVVYAYKTALIEKTSKRERLTDRPLSYREVVSAEYRVESLEKELLKRLSAN